MNVGQMIARAARRFPERPAVIAGERRLTFREVDERSNRLANALASLGVAPGDRVALVLHNCLEYVEIEFALSKGGFVAVPLNSHLRIEDHSYMIRDAQANTLILGPEFARPMKAREGELRGVRRTIVLGNAEQGQVAYRDLLATGSPKDPPTIATMRMSDLHNIMYTSGTTGRPKGVMHSHRTKWTVALNMLTDLGPIQSDDRLLHVAPLTHGTGLFVLPWFVRGAANVILPGFDPEQVCRTIEREHVTTFKVVPTILVRLLAYPDLNRYDLSSLHTIIYGASPMPVDKLREALRRFGPILVQIYGQSEAPATICILRKEDHVLEGTPEQTQRLAAAGTPFTNVALRIVDDNCLEVRPGQVGEVIVQGDHMMAGYWNLPETTEETLQDGWVHTRDLGYMDERGYVYLVDRKSDMIISGGMNIYPREIEEILYSHPDVLEASVFGIPDERWGEAVKAAVVLRSGAEPNTQQLIDFCGNHLASYKKPKSIDFLPELPKNAYGKIQKNLLREPYWKGYTRRVN